LQDLFVFSLKFRKIKMREPIIGKIVFFTSPPKLGEIFRSKSFSYPNTNILDTSNAPLKTELHYKKNGFPFSVRLIKRF